MRGTVGEYADDKNVQRDLLRVQTVESDGKTKPFDRRTRSVRVCFDEPHWWGFNEDAGQLRPGDAVESHNVDADKGWCMWFEEDN